MAKPTQTLLTKQGKHAGVVCSLNDTLVWSAFLPGDAKYEASEMETVEAVFVFHICCPSFAVIEEGA